MRPNKPINSGAHRSGTAARGGKGRFFATGLPPAAPVGNASDSEPEGRPAAPRETTEKYAGRSSVVPRQDNTEVVIGASEGSEEWVDPLDNDEIDLTHITIDLRETLRDSPPDTYYQRHSSRVPGRQ